MEGDNHAEGPMEAAANNPDSDISTVRQAVVKNRPDVLKKLIEEGESIDEDALNRAAFYGHTECVRLLINEVPIQKNRPQVFGGSGETALHNAVMSGRPECVRVLLEQSCDVNVRTNQGSTPLMYAMVRSIKSDKECIKMLLEHGANTKMSDINGRTALHRELYKEQPDLEVVKWLVQGTDNPPTLQQLARTKIRVHLADCNKFCTGNIRKLNIPEIVKEYLRLTDLEDGSEEQKLMSIVSEILF